jgi:hypothetical protein
LLRSRRIVLLPPQGYLEMLGLLTGARLVLSDSGGLQEETTALGVPCLTIRENTERPITVEQGTNTLVGCDPRAIRDGVDEILSGAGKTVAFRSSGMAGRQRGSPPTSHRGCSLATRRAAASPGMATMPGQPITNALTIDVEDYFQVSAFAPYIPRDQWPLRECRVERNVERILLMLDEQKTRATFFTLGWIAERYPQLVRRMVDAGHELASHGYGHQRASDLSAADFSADVGRAKALLEDLSGQEVKGYRAPSFSIGEANLWAFRLSPARRLPLQFEHLPDPP